ncbi:polyphosphate kinase 1 [Zobellella denitrificans]|uniref:polyphosphate kinase 1 n=1 Tax=Zobellella denitrificans TaxID=347534 RepID=UPI000B8BB433|nr:polyphosphate kinase 1 [Zobellella denitrificans]OXS17154.1 polyphosphate kinase 1 [Zobellella denitrificans]
MSTDKWYLEKELSWLSFNERVLQEAMDKSVPLIERVRFLGIFSNNQDEFFRVRVSDVKRQVMIDADQGKTNGAASLLRNIQQKVIGLANTFDEVYKELIVTLARQNIFLLNENQLSPEQEAWVKRYFDNEVRAYLSPIILRAEIDPVRFLKDEYTYLCVGMVKGEERHYALVEIPTDVLPRFVVLPPGKSRRKKSILIMDNVIRLCLNDLFAGFFEYDDIHAYSFKMTRDAEYDLSDQLDQSLLEKMSDGLKQRLTALPVRFVHDREMPPEMVQTLVRKLRIQGHDAVMSGGRYHNFKDFIAFPNVGRKHLVNKPLPPLKCREFRDSPSSFDAIRRRDILLYFPYHSFSHVTEFVRQASFDPAVLSIKMNVYRVASLSRIMYSLMDAANNGKKVTVVIELRARFDEAANIEWAKILTEAGITVEFGVPSLKVHSKLCLVTRREGDQLVQYAHVGTGNFNEKTANIYTDFSLLTANPEITGEVAAVFDFIRQPYRRAKFNHLLVSPINSRRGLYGLIDAEIANARQGLPARIILKLNNLVDKGLINRLYGASQAGVDISLIVRGMCSLVPGVIGVSDNIRAISIVDRYLEHPRVMVFHNNGQPRVYISSADWMTRNLDFRVEVATPILDPVLRQRIIDILEIQLSDTTKARILDREQRNHYVDRGNRRKIRSQTATYDYLKALEG